MVARSVLSRVLILCLVLLPCFALAQQAGQTAGRPAAQDAGEDAGRTAAPDARQEATAPPKQSADRARSDSDFISLTSRREMVLSMAILLFGVVIIFVQYFLLRGVVEKKTENIANTNLVTLIVIGTLVLISSGFSNEQIAPALGLFGTIAGYILGRSERDRKE